MAELGSIFDDDHGDHGDHGDGHGDDGDGRPRGPDLRVSVEVPRAALGATLRAPVPSRIAADGELHERAVLDGDDPDTVELHLPEDLPERALLRLRGQGGVHADGRPGDLLVVVELVDREPRQDEVILGAPTALAPTGATIDVTWWLLLALALIGGGVLAFVALGA